MYSHLGRGQPGPSFVTAVNFRRAAIAGLVLFSASHLTHGSPLSPGEPASLRLLAGGGLILGGIALSLLRRRAPSPSTA